MDNWDSSWVLALGICIGGMVVLGTLVVASIAYDTCVDGLCVIQLPF